MIQSQPLLQISKPLSDQTCTAPSHRRHPSAKFISRQQRFNSSRDPEANQYFDDLSYGQPPKLANRDATPEGLSASRAVRLACGYFDSTIAGSCSVLFPIPLIKAQHPCRRKRRMNSMGLDCFKPPRNFPPVCQWQPCPHIKSA